MLFKWHFYHRAQATLFVPTICATCVVFRGLAVHWWKFPVFRPHRRKHCLDAAHSYACFYVVYASVCVGLLNGSADPRPAARLRIVFTARCYASAVLAMGLCPSVRLSVTSRKAQFLGKYLGMHTHGWKRLRTDIVSTIRLCLIYTLCLKKNKTLNSCP